MSRESDSSIELLSVADESRSTDSIPSNPIRVRGRLKVSLFGLSIARIDLDLAVAAVERFVDYISAKTAHRPGELEALSRDELYELARDADVRGRSRMTRDELVQVLSARD